MKIAAPSWLITLSLLGIGAAAPCALARQPAVEVQYLAVANPNHQSTPPAPVTPAPFNRSPQGFDPFPGARAILSYPFTVPVTAAFIVDGVACTSFFPAGVQAAGMPNGTTYRGGLTQGDGLSRMDSAGNCVFRVPLLNPTSTVSYWGPLGNLQPLTPATRVGPTASGWWLKQRNNDFLVGTSPDPTTVLFSTAQRPVGMSELVTGYTVGSPSLFDGGQVTIALDAFGPSSVSGAHYCIADSSGYRVVFRDNQFNPDLGYFHGAALNHRRGCMAGGDGTVLCTGGLSNVAGDFSALGAIWKTNALGHSTLLVLEGQQAPALPAGVLVAPFGEDLRASGHSIIDANGSVVAWINLSGEGVTSANNRALLLFDHQGPHLLLRSGDTIRFGDRDVTVPAFCGQDASGNALYTGVWMNRRGDIALWSGSMTPRGFIAVYNKRTGWAGLAAGDTPPISGFSSDETISQVLTFFFLSGSLLSSGYDMGIQRLDDDGWVYFVQSLVSGGAFATKARVILPLCPADFDADGTVDFFDYDAFVSCFEGGPCRPNTTADFDHDGSVDFFDYDAFGTAFDTPC